jgi:segregation and condensation protein A
MHTAEYRVRLNAFEGPLDLLLYLIRRAEVEITDIPIATITDQYLDYLQGGDVDSIDIDKAGEFLVMAATLMEIKSRMLMPPEEAGSGEEGEAARAGRRGREDIDPRAELVRQLLAYKKFRDAAECLNHQLREWESRYPAGGAGIDRAQLGEAIDRLSGGGVDIEDVDLVDLVEAFGRIIETVDLSRLGEHHVAMDETPVELHAEDILDRLRRAAEVGGPSSGELGFAEIFAGRTRSEMIGLFLAMLELVKQRRIAIRQEAEAGAPEQAPRRTHSRILLSLADPADAQPDAPNQPGAAPKESEP